MARARRVKFCRLPKVPSPPLSGLQPADLAEIEVDNPLALEPGDRIKAVRSVRNDPLGRLHAHHQIDEAQYRGGRAFQADWERAERGPQAVDPSREYVDGVQGREAITESQRQAVLRLNRIQRELGTDGAALVHDVLVQGLTMDDVAQRRSVRSQRWNDYFAKRLQECLDRLALFYGFATTPTRGIGARPTAPLAAPRR